LCLLQRCLGGFDGRLCPQVRLNCVVVVLLAADLPLQKLCLPIFIQLRLILRCSRLR
jgi:hypothetical protein